MEVVINDGVAGDNHGAIPALIRYNIPYFIDDAPPIITFSLDDDLSLLAVLELLMMLLLSVSLNFEIGTL